MQADVVAIKPLIYIDKVLVDLWGNFFPQKVALVFLNLRKSSYCHTGSSTAG